MEGTPPPKELPIIWCDFNACGLSGAEDDDCYYSLHREKLSELVPVEKMEVFIYDDDLDEEGNPEVFGFVAKLERISGFNSEWRARPNKNTWYRGPVPRK